MKEILDFIRGLQRPFVVVCIVLVVIGIVSFLVAQFGNVDMADKTLSTVLVAMALIIGYLFGERKAGKSA